MAKLRRAWAAIVVGLSAGNALGEEGGSVSGRLLHEATGKPLAGRVLVLADEDEDARWRRVARRELPEVVAEGRAAADGTFVVALPAAGVAYRLEALADGHARVVVVEGADGRAATSAGDVPLPEGGVLAGEVRGQAGPVAGALVALERRMGSWRPGTGAWPAPLFGVTDAKGRFRLEGAARDGGRLVVRAAGLAVQTVEVPGPRPEVVVKLAPGLALDGTVVDEATGKPVAGGRVEADAPAGSCLAESDASGRFRLDGLAAGTVVVRAVSPSHAPSSAKVSLPRRPDEPPLILKLAAAGALRIVATDRSGAPIPRARVAYRAASTSRESIVFADAAGVAAISGISPGTTVTATVRARGFREASTGTLRVPAVGSRRMRVVLERNASLEGEVVDAKGSPAAGVTIAARTDGGHRVLPRWDERPVRATTDARGRFRLDDLPAEVLRLTFVHPRLARRELPVPRLRPGEARRGMRVTMEPGAGVSGRVVDDTGAPVAGAVIQVEPAEQHVFPLDPESVLSRGVSGVDGAFELGGLAPGDVLVRASRPGFVDPEPLPVEVSAGRGATLKDVVLRRARTVTGRVLDGARQPVAGAMVSVTVAGERGFFGSGPQASTDADGRFEVKDVDPAAELSVHARAKGKGSCRRRGVRATGEPLELVLEPTSFLRGRVLEKGEDRAVPAFSIGWMKSVAGGTSSHGMTMVMGGRTETFQDEDGAFQLEDLPPGKLLLRVRAHGFVPVEIDGVDATTDPDVPPVVVELERGHRVSGRVIDRTSPNHPPIPGALVTVQEATEASSMRGSMGQDPVVLTDGDGAFVLEGLPAGSRILRAEVDRRPAATKEIEVEGDVDGVEIAIPRGARVTGEVRRRDGSPAPNARVDLHLDGPSELRFEVSDATGAFAFDGIAPGAYVLRAEMPSGVGSPRAKLLVADTDPAPVKLTIHEGVRVTGTVTGLVRESLERVRIEAMSEGASGSARAAPDGSFSLGNLLPGRLEVTALLEPEGRRAVGASLLLDEEETEATVELIFPDGSQVAGKVTRGGKPLGGVKVMAARRDDPSRFHGGTTTAADGSYALDGFPDGTYDLSLLAFDPMLQYEAELVVKGVTTFDVEIPGSLVEVTVRDGASNAPVPSAHLTLATEEEGSSWSSRTADTDASGKATFAEIPDGAYVLTAAADGFASTSVKARVEQGEVKGGVTIDLPPEGVIVLSLIDARTASAPASITVTRVVDDVAATRTDVPGSDGTFRLHGLPRGPAFLVVQAPAAAPITLPAIAAPGEARLTATAGGRIEVLLPEGTATLRLLRPDGATEWLAVGWFAVERETVVSGPRALVGPVVAGSYRLLVTTAGGTASHEVTVREGETTRVSGR